MARKKEITAEATSLKQEAGAVKNVNLEARESNVDKNLEPKNRDSKENGNLEARDQEGFVSESDSQNDTETTKTVGDVDSLEQEVASDKPDGNKKVENLEPQQNKKTSKKTTPNKAQRQSAKKKTKSPKTETERKPHLGKKIYKAHDVDTSHANDNNIKVGDAEANSEKGSNRTAIEFVSALAYILFFLPLIFCRKEPFALYHANQALLLTILMLILYLAFAFFPSVRVIALPIVVIFHVLGIFFGVYNSAHGRARALPVIGKLELIKWNKK